MLPQAKGGDFVFRCVRALQQAVWAGEASAVSDIAFCPRIGF